MKAPRTRAGQWLLDRSQWEEGLRAFRVRINATAGPDDMHRHILAIEQEAASDPRLDVLLAAGKAWNEARDIKALAVAEQALRDALAAYKEKPGPFSGNHALYVDRRQDGGFLVSDPAVDTADTIKDYTYEDEGLGGT
jgi:hypothetical protein